jgi:hypothetical protein
VVLAAAASPILFKLTVAIAPFEVLPSAIKNGPSTSDITFGLGAEKVVLTVFIIGLARLLAVKRVVIVFILVN